MAGRDTRAVRAVCCRQTPSSPPVPVPPCVALPSVSFCAFLAPRSLRRVPRAGEPPRHDRQFPLARRRHRRARHGVGEGGEREDRRGAGEGSALRRHLQVGAGDGAGEGPPRLRALPRRRALQLLAGLGARARDLASHDARELSHRVARVDHGARSRLAGEGGEGQLGVAGLHLRKARRAALPPLPLRWR